MPTAHASRAVAEEFTATLVERISQLGIGPGLQRSTTHGPLVDHAAVEKVREHIEDAVPKGAKIKIGGSKPDGPSFFFQPTVLSAVTASMQLTREGGFGSLARISEFGDEDEVVHLRNDTEFGLAAYFFSRDVN